MLVRRFEMPWRPTFEVYAALAWIVAGLGFAAYPVASTAAKSFLLAIGGFAFAVGLLRAYQALWILRLKASLSGRAMEVATLDRYLMQLGPHTEVFLGRGFEWTPVHTQRLYDLAKVDFRKQMIGAFWRRILGISGPAQPDTEIGLPFIHGLEPMEGPLSRPLQNFEGGTLLVGTTQSGKGVALTGLITQAVRRGDVVIIIDPKNSKRMKRVVESACKRFRETDTFMEFHPAFPEVGIRLDPMYNWQKPTELASRIQSVMPPDTAGAFTAFGWDAVNVVVQGCVELEVRPNLMTIARYIEGGIEPILEQTLRRFFDSLLGASWQDTPEFRRVLESARRGDMRRTSDRATPDLLALVSYYLQHVPESSHSKVIDAQIRTFQHNREHYQKITANLLPILSMLTSGALGKSLSPDPFDADDARPIMNTEKIVSGGHVLYVCLDSLPDPGVASAIGAILLADTAALAGMRYNLGGDRRVSLFVDETANVINAPLIELLNKGAEGGFFTTCAMQTLADMAKRLGSEDAARMALGNLNNLIALRTKDGPTQKFVVETFGKAGVHVSRVGVNHGVDSHVGDFSSGYSVQVTENLEEAVPPDILGKLPNLQYFAMVSGGRLLKGRFQIIATESSIPEET
ncbi:MAG: conjugative transfer system coupling protein TraD [Fimbriimonadaceae bacterium]|nr:conjugative transfer system coupling protein TraD [Fimbriimonadaceae bacterium]